jgi:hypothetical protein
VRQLAERVEDHRMGGDRRHGEQRHIANDRRASAQTANGQQVVDGDTEPSGLIDGKGGERVGSSQRSAA